MSSRSNRHQRAVKEMLKDLRLQEQYERAGTSKANPRAKVTINDLPNELLLEIIGYFELSTDPRSGLFLEQDVGCFVVLASLLRVNKKLHALVKPFISQTVDFGWMAAPLRFLRTIITHPEIGSNVRTLRIGYGDDDVETPAEHPPSAADKRIIKGGLKALGYPQWKTMATKLDKKTPGYDFLFQMIMMYTPNITSLGVKHRLKNTGAGWLRLIKKAVDKPPVPGVPGFSHLKTIYLDTGNSLRTTDILPLFALPALENLVITCAYDPKVPRFTNSPWSTLQRSSSIKELRLFHCCIHTDTLVRLIEACGPLRLFLCHYWFKRDEEEEDEEEGVSSPAHYPQYKELTRALLRHRDTLESLKFGDDLDIDDWDDMPPHNQFGSLASMVKLTELFAPLVALHDRESDDSSKETVANLPPSLKEVAVLDVGIPAHDMESRESMLPLLLNIMGGKESHGHLPALKKVTVIPGAGGWWCRELTQLVPDFAKHGMELDIETFDKDGYPNFGRLGSPDGSEEEGEGGEWDDVTDSEDDEDYYGYMDTHDLMDYDHNYYHSDDDRYYLFE